MPAEVSLPAGTITVASHQALGRVAAQLLDGRSEDSLATWNYFDASLASAEGNSPAFAFPALRLPEIPDVATEAVGEDVGRD